MLIRARQCILCPVESPLVRVHPLYVVKLWSMGKRRVFPVYDVLLEALDFDIDNPNELLIIRVHPPYCTFRVAKPERLFPLDQMNLSDLPPVWPKVPALERKP